MASKGAQRKGSLRQGGGGDQNDEGMVSRSSFQMLLYRLDQEHEREVSQLRDEILRLQKLCKQGSNPSFDIGNEQPPSPIRSGLPPVPQKQGPFFGESLKDFLHVEAERPDEEALAAAFAVVTGIEDSGEEVNLLPKDVYCAASGSPKGEAETAALLTGQARNGNQDQAWWKGQDGRWIGNGGEPFDDQLEREPSPIQQESTGIASTAVAANGGRAGCRDTTMSSPEFLNAESMVAAFPVKPMDGWFKLIGEVQKQQALEILPKLNPVWKTDNMMRAQGLLGIPDLKQVVSKVTKETSSHKPHDHAQQRKECFLIRWMLPWMMHPTCRRRVFWDCGGILLLLHDLIFIPMEAFQTGTDGIGQGYRDFQSVLDFFSAIFWTCDICVSFLTGYYSAEGFVELFPPRVARHYMKGWLPMDLLIVTCDWSTMFLGMSSASGFMRLGKTVSRFMRVLRLLRFLKMNTAMKEMMERINSEYILQLVNLLKTLIFIVVINHYIACTWYALGASGWFNSKWPNKFLVNYPDSFFYAYTTSLHWSLTQFTPASMEVVPQNELERFFTIMVIIMALVAFSSFVSSITAAMTHIRQIKAKQLEAEAKIRQFFSEHKISHAMASRVWHFLRKNKAVGIKRLKESDVPALKNLPQRIKEDLRVEIYLPMLREHPFLHAFHLREETSIFKICNTAIRERTLIVGEELFKAGDPIQMFFVAGGQCCYTERLDHNNGCETREFFLRRGNWACEVAAWADKAMLDGPFIAHGGPCDLILVDTEKFTNILQSYDNSANFLTKYAERFMDRFIGDSNTITHGSEFDDYNVLFNDPEMIYEFVRHSEESCNHRRSRPRDLFMFGGLGSASPMQFGGRGTGRHTSNAKPSLSLPPVGASTSPALFAHAQSGQP